MFAYDSSAEADDLLPASAVSIRSLLRVLATANIVVRSQAIMSGHSPYEATTFTIADSSAAALESAIVNEYLIDNREFERFLNLLSIDQNPTTRPIVVTPEISGQMVFLVQSSERVFRGLADEPAGQMIAYGWRRIQGLARSLGRQIGSRFCSTVFHCAKVQFELRDSFPFEFRSYDCNAPTEFLRARLEPLILLGLETGRLAEASNDQYSSHLLAQAVGHAIASFCLSQNPDGQPK